jgi:hypothetical protein
LYTKFIVSPFKEKFPEEKLFCEPSTLFSEGDAPTLAAKVLVVGFFATSRFFQQTGERQPAVMRNLTGSSGRCHSEWVVQQFIYTNTKAALKCNSCRRQAASEDRAARQLWQRRPTPGPKHGQRIAERARTSAAP